MLWHYLRMHHLKIVAGTCALTLLAGCQWLRSSSTETPVINEPVPVAPVTLADPVATHRFELAEGQDVVGELQVTIAHKEDTLSDIARRFNLGYEELVRANPGVDPWLPGEGRQIVLPTQFVLPNAPREGLVVNLAALRVFFYPKRKPGEPQTVITHPIGIGKVGWNTPEGVTKVVSRRKDPVWVPPASVRKEHAERGDPLPKIVPAGPDNPLGAYAMNLGWPGYLIHGTNKPYGVGMRSSHGCLRFYPEDIALLFDEIAIGTKVQVVNQRLVSGWHAGQMYVQVMPASDEELAAQQKAKRVVALLTPATQTKWAEQARVRGQLLNTNQLQSLVAAQTGITTPVTGTMSQAEWLAAARRVDNRVPPGATWNGNKELLVTAEEFEAMKNGVILPKKDAPATPPAQPATKPRTNKSSSVTPRTDMVDALATSPATTPFVTPALTSL